ncbi:MAG: 3'-5' exonuclease [Clostridia bacterium]|nr:3'-5' exonuclease [Clostridia bacterium]
MRYLIFDIECCDGEHICEFGYVITDPSFTVLEQNVLLIDPEKPFYLEGRGNRRDLHLWFDEEDYRINPTFEARYPMLKELIETEDQCIIGHAIENDAAFLRTACERYGCKPLSFTFYDSQRMYSDFANIHRSVSLSDACEALAVPPPEYLHRSDSDAKATMQLVKAMCQAMDVSFSEFVALCPYVVGKTEAGQIFFLGEEEKWARYLGLMQENRLDPDGARELYHRVISHTEPMPGAVNRLYGERIAFDERLEADTDRMIRLLQMITDYGGYYVSSAKKSHILVMAEGDPNESHRYTVLNDGSKKSKRVKILSLADFYRYLEVSESDVAAYPYPTAQSLAADERSQIYKRKRHAKSFATTSAGDSTPTTIGAALKSRGIDLSKLFSEEE